MLAEYGRLSLAGGAGAGDPDGRRLPDRGAARQRARAREEAALRLALLEGGLPPPRRRGARGAGGRARSSSRRTSRRRCASWSRPSSRRSPRARAGRRPSRPPTTASTGATSPRSSCAATQEQGGLITKEDLARWQVKIEEPVKTTLQGHRRLQAHGLDPGPGAAAGAQHPRERRPRGRWATTRRATSTRSTRR